MNYCSVLYYTDGVPVEKQMVNLLFLMDLKQMYYKAK